MLFKKTKLETVVFLNEFAKENSKRAKGRLEKYFVAYKISDNEFYFSFMALEIFTIDYACTIFFKDDKKTSLFLDEFYSELKKRLKSTDLYDALSLDVVEYSSCVRESKDVGEMIQKIGFKFSNKLIEKIDLMIAMAIGIEFNEIFQITKEALKKTKL